MDEACFPSSENCHVTQLSDLPFNVEQLAAAVRDRFSTKELPGVRPSSWTSLGIKPAPPKRKSQNSTSNGIIEVDLENSSPESGSTSLWTDRPMTELLGDLEAWSKVTAWLDEWRKSGKSPSKPSKKRRRGEFCFSYFPAFCLVFEAID
jgi:hypothetical protein